ncbi:auxin efflux carrier [Ascodesmis nigricans]|uniref:Auxin efflux carrier n=1 Tax=Ascodesmis nigricans TaxID=341454 RepID=A0A4S2MQ61_9PEZI|nr:auxin efflux carrier [Ascodesmis nigricans]
MAFSVLDHESVSAALESGGGGHPSLMNLCLLVFEAVLEVVCVALPGYIIARMGMFTVEHQKFVANLNVSLFTPCLIFTKLASQLTMSKMVELGIIPVIFVFMTAVSYVCAWGLARVFGFEKRAKNFLIAMAVFGNSNSLPISLVLSLSMTISGLHWDRIPGDNDEEVGARGILYLLIFQQLGQLLRWSWGYHVLLAPHPKPDAVENGAAPAEPYRDNVDVEAQNEYEEDDIDPFLSPQFENSFAGLAKYAQEQQPLLQPPHHDNGFLHSHYNTMKGSSDGPVFQVGPPSVATTAPSSHPSFASLLDQSHQSSRPTSISGVGSSSNLPLNDEDPDDIISFPPIKPISPTSTASERFLIPRWKRSPVRPSLSSILAKTTSLTTRFAKSLWSFMNPPLWAMLAAIIVASIPRLQSLFFTPGTFIQTSVTRAVSQSGSVAVPLILVVLGANLANSTSPSSSSSHSSTKDTTRLLTASLLARMLLPFLVIAPAIALMAKYSGISILDDPIFVVVCYLLAGAPSALQLAQICQINEVYEDVVTRVLFWSYVVVILPSTMMAVVGAVGVVRWSM